MSCFRLPQWLIDRIDLIRRQFLWSKPHPARGIHLLNWRTVCLPLTCGGLGVPDLKLQNLSLLLRWWWRLFTHDNKLWRTYATTIYAASNAQSSPLILSKKGSFFWNSISSLRPLFHSCSQFRITSGCNISFWFDGWDGLPLQTDHFGPLRHRRISLFQARSCLTNLLDALLMLRQQTALYKLQNFTPTHGRDTLTWTISSSGQFTVNSVYSILSQGGKVKSATTFLWRTKVTPSMKIFFFLLLNNRLLTHDNMQRRNLPHSQGCVMCPNCLPETVLHLFFRCSFATQIWRTLAAQVGFPILRVQDSITQTYIMSMPADTHTRNFWGALFVTTTWLLWKERNNRTFRHTRTTVQVLTARIMQEAQLCYTHC